VAAGGGSGKLRTRRDETSASFSDYPELPAPAGASAGSARSPRSAATPAPAGAGTSDRNALLLEAMKEELFQLEIDRQQGKVTPEEYGKAKAALDETIKRALARTQNA
jgi:hypothetical protein